jgi:hypothetical protein
MALLILISAVTTYSSLGSPHINYVASVERVHYKDCLVIKKAAPKQHVVTCLKESK